MTEHISPKIDFNALVFPTDGLTIGGLRRREAARFDADDRGLYDELHTMAVMQTIAAEMDLAESTFAKIAGGRDPLDGFETNASLVRDLTNLYEELGIGEGPASRETLIERIQSDAQAQARAKSGRTI